MLQWFRSYLVRQSFCVLYCNQTSYAVSIVCSATHGSVLRAPLFMFYMADQEHQVNIRVGKTRISGLFRTFQH